MENSNEATIIFDSRPDNEVNFNKVVSTVENPDTLVERHCKGKFSFVGFYIYIVLLPVWYLQMHGRGLRLIEKYQILKQQFRKRLPTVSSTDTKGRYIRSG